jgi:DNA (cytosine-5)-methyltransferase 1
MNFLDLFSGIGGFARGAELAGLHFDNHLFSEVEPTAIKIYSKNYPAAVGLGDIRSIDGGLLRTQYGGEWVLAGGFPCQDISNAGSGRGINASRSGLWWEYYRLICEIQPKAIVIENVSALLSKGFERVLCSLASIGYDAEWCVLSARQFGAPHYRKRLYCVAYASGSLRRRSISTGSQVGVLGEVHQPELQTQGTGFWTTWAGEWEAHKNNSESTLVRIDDGVSRKLDKLRVKALGNAVVPQCAEWVFRRMILSGLLDNVKQKEII